MTEEQKEIRRQRAKEWNSRPQVKEWIKELRIKRLFGLTKDEYNHKLVGQGRKCAICEKPPSKANLAVDHNHTNGLIRGLLCKSCNLLLGNSNESIHTLQRAIAYLRYWDIVDEKSRFIPLRKQV